MRNWSAAAIAAFLVVGCNSQEKGRNGAAEGNAAGNATGAQTGATNPAAPPVVGDPSAQSIQPGEWEMTSLMSSVEAPGAPPEMLAQLRRTLPSQRQTQRQCITPEEAANPSRNLVGRSAAQQGCQFSDSTFAGGVIRVAANCRQPGGPASMQMALEGSFSATAMNTGLRVSLTGPRNDGRGTQTIIMTGRMTGRRIGECSARPAPPRMTVPAPAPPPIPRP